MLALSTTCETNSQARTVRSVQRVVKRADTVYICRMQYARCSLSGNKTDHISVTRLNGYKYLEGEQDQVSIFVYRECGASGCEFSFRNATSINVTSASTIILQF